jgi:alkyl sulfatase BDS1-like metallo-beta-lactamase superfamily hydrolase
MVEGSDSIDHRTRRSIGGRRRTTRATAATTLPRMSGGPRPSRSFDVDGGRTVTTPAGQVAHEAHLAQSARLERRLHTVRPGVWCLVGNGLSNQTFVDAPEGIIAIDTGESVQEMTAALAELRTVTDRPIAAVMYTHFHYVSGTTAITADSAAMPIYGHAKISFNRARAATEIAPAYSRGLVEQFGVALPMDGPDGLVNVGLGRFFRDPAHAPFTSGFVPPTTTFDRPTTLTVAGLAVEVTPAPSDADDSVTYWFPSLGVAVNNNVWPVLFNVFAIRGEEYRDPRVLLTGLDHLLSLHADHLVGAHGPPISGATEIDQRVTRYRDAIQYLWDQTVRLTNQGFTGPELAHAIRLPDHCDDDYITSEYYGVSEHHVRQIRSGLFGFFDGDEAELFPLPPADRAGRMVSGFGGRDEVRRRAEAAIDADDLRWAVELCSWLVRSDGAEQADRDLMSRSLRTIGQRTSAANIRNWCLTRAREFDGSIDGSRYHRHRLHRAHVAADPAATVPVLRVLLDPDAATGLDLKLAWDFGDAGTAGVHLRHSIACPTDGVGADATIVCDAATWAGIVAGDVALSTALAEGTVRIDGDADTAVRALACFDVSGLQS